MIDIIAKNKCNSAFYTFEFSIWTVVDVNSLIALCMSFSNSNQKINSTVCQIGIIKSTFFGKSFCKTVLRFFWLWCVAKRRLQHYACWYSIWNDFKTKSLCDSYVIAILKISFQIHRNFFLLQVANWCLHHVTSFQINLSVPNL